MTSLSELPGNPRVTNRTAYFIVFQGPGFQTIRGFNGLTECRSAYAEVRAARVIGGQLINHARVVWAEHGETETIYSGPIV